MNITENQQLKELQKILNFPSQDKFAKALGIKQGSLSDIYRAKDGIKVSSSIKRILEKEYSINMEWLEKGDGEVFTNMASDTIQQNINYDYKGVPYYDVDFICGFDIVENNQTINPEYYIDLKPYNNANFWVRASGHSMEPKIDNGDIIALKEIGQWSEFISFGEVYAIVTDDFRTIKIVSKGSTNDTFMLIPMNDSPEFVAQEIPKCLIRKVFQVIGVVKNT